MKCSIDAVTVVSLVRSTTLEVLSTMLDMQAEPEETYTENTPHSTTEGVVSFVGLAGADWAGTGSLRCSSESACRFASRFLMSEYSAVDDEVLDAFAELTNMIIGNFKNEVEQRLGPTGLSIPTVIHGKNFSTRSLSKEEWIVVPFRHEDDRIEVKVCLKERATVSTINRYGEREVFVLAH